MNLKFDLTEEKSTDVVIKMLIDNNLISEDYTILNKNLFLEFGLLTFLNYKLHWQQKYYDNNKHEKSLPYFKYQIVSLKNKNSENGKIAILLYDKNKNYHDKHLEKFVMGNPLDKIENNNGNCKNCLLNLTLKFNILAGNLNETSFIHKNNMEKQCEKHKTEILNYVLENEDFRLLGCDGYIINFNPEFVEIIEETADSNPDILFNLFLSIYMKNYISANGFLYDCVLTTPFKSHEMDVFLEKKNENQKNIILIESNVRMDDVSEDFKKKVFNMLNMNYLCEKIIFYYLTFSEQLEDNILYLLKNHKNKTNHFFINYKRFPKIFDNISLQIKDKSKKEVLDIFENFLKGIGNEIINDLNS